MVNFFGNKKRAEYEIFSVWWFLVLALISIVVVIAVNMYVSAQVEVRGFEAGVIYNKISNCIIDNAVLNEKVLDNDFNIYSECDLNNKSIFEHNFFFTLSIKDASGVVLKKIQSEGVNYFDDCLVGNLGAKGASFPKCVYRNESVYYFSEGQRNYYTIEMMTASNNYGENVKPVKIGS
jgi:hypothetical protein